MNIKNSTLLKKSRYTAILVIACLGSAVLVYMYNLYSSEKIQNVMDTGNVLGVDAFRGDEFPVSDAEAKYDDVESISAGQEVLGIAAGGVLPYRDQKYLDQYFSDLSDLGVTWIRFDVDWSLVQPNESDKYEWSTIDRVISTARKYSVHVLGVITYTPEWARKSVCKSDYRCPPENSEDFGVFAGKVAARYRGVINIWEIWNEPNLQQFWASGPNANLYSELLRSGYSHVHGENQRSIVISGGLAAVSTEEDRISPEEFIKALYVNGLQQYSDAIALHPYTFPVLPDYKAQWNNWQKMYVVRQLMIDNGDENKKIWITEYGAPTWGPGKGHSVNQYSGFKFGSDFMREDAQRDIIKQVIDLYKQHSAWIGPFFWHSLKDISNNRSSPENFYGLLRYDGSKKPAYDIYKNAIAAINTQ